MSDCELLADTADRAGVRLDRETLANYALLLSMRGIDR